MNRSTVSEEARRILDDAWDPYRGYCYPNRETYPHLWLWDSCFHAIAWAFVGDDRCGRELHAVFGAQLASGFVPHMRYAGATFSRGPLDFASSFTQPPVFAHAAHRLADRGFTPPGSTLGHIEAALEWLWRERMTDDGLLYIVHPWESGADDSPRWDGWIGHSDWNRPEWTALDFSLLEATTYDSDGAATSSSDFEVMPAAFNAIAAHAAAEYADLSGSAPWRRRASELTGAIDGLLWNDAQALWNDAARRGGGESLSYPTLDGALGLLATSDASRAKRVVDRLNDPAAFRAEYGLRYVTSDHGTYRPDQYWRGSSWMQMNYLTFVGAQRFDGTALSWLPDAARRGALASQFAEHWNPDTGEGLGAIPQTWSALAVALDGEPTATG